MRRREISTSPLWSFPNGPTRSLEETFENREQIEISKYYEKLPKPAIIATEEFLEGKVYFRENNEAETQPQEA